VRLGDLEGRSVREAALQWHVVPAKDRRIQVVERRKSIEFVQTRNDSAVLNVCESAKVQNKIRAPSERS
jgi:hypothetical protein